MNANRLDGEDYPRRVRKDPLAKASGYTAGGGQVYDLAYKGERRVKLARRVGDNAPYPITMLWIE